MTALAHCRAPTSCLRGPAAGNSSTARSAQGRALQQQRWGQQARQAPLLRRCRATAEKEGTQQADAQPKVPDTPPTPTGAAQQQSQEPSASSQVAAQADTLSVEEIQRRAAQLREQKASAAELKKDAGLVQGVMEEVGLIKWPSPGKATLNTLLVIGIVAGTAALLLAINSLLGEVSKVVY